MRCDSCLFSGLQRVRVAAVISKRWCSVLHHISVDCFTGDTIFISLFWLLISSNPVIMSSTVVLLVCRSRFESQWETPKFDSRGANIIGVIQREISSVNYRVSDKTSKVSHLQPFGGHLGDGVKYTLLEAF